jgi:phosphoribosylanthranilate isomerase
LNFELFSMVDRYYPQIKICGLTRPNQARACADLGADAVGLVFFEKSPRNVTLEQAAAIKAVLPSRVAAVGVFVDPDRDFLANTVRRCGLDMVQLHGSEPPEFVADMHADLKVPIIKVLFATRSPGLADAAGYGAAAYLVECGRGALPGGNAMAWDWTAAQGVGRDFPLILAGGLAPDNVADAIGTCLPDAVDASSSLEAGPGVKDLEKVARFMAQVKKTESLYRSADKTIRFVFTPRLQHLSLAEQKSNFE